MRYSSSQHGQALITVIFSAVIGILIVTGAMYAFLSNLEGTTQDHSGALAYSAAETAAESAVLGLLRSPSYTGETTTFGNGATATSAVTVGSDVLITATGSVGSITRKIEVSAHYEDTSLVVDSWKEIP